MELTNEKGEALCQVCGKGMNIIVPAHLKLHGITMVEYKEKYPNAPMSSSAFRAKQQYRHRGDVFKEIKPEVPVEKLPEFSLDKIPSQSHPINDENFFKDIHSFIKNSTLTEYPNENNTIPKHKINILNLFLKYFPDVKNSYSVEKYNLSGFLEYKLITDIAIPSKKLDIEFPDSFWHNYDILKYNRDLKLKQDGWNIIDIKGKYPSIEEIEEIIQTKILKKK